MKFELYKIICRKTTIALFTIIFITIFVTVLLNLTLQEPHFYRYSPHEFVVYCHERAVYTIGTTGSVFCTCCGYGSIFPVGPGARALPFQADIDGPLIQRILQMYQQVYLPANIIPNEGFDEIRRFLSAAMFFVGIIIILGVAPVFAEERSTGVDKIILTAKKGKSKVVLHKILASLVYTAAVYMIFVLAIALPHLIFHGVYGWHHPMNFYLFLGASPYNFTILTLLLLHTGLGLISGFLLCMTGLVISTLSRNAFIAMVPSLLLFIISPFRVAELSVPLHRFMTLFPANAMWSWELWDMPDFYNVFGLLIDRPVMIVIFSVIGSLALVASCFFITKRMEASH